MVAQRIRVNVANSRNMGLSLGDESTRKIGDAQAKQIPALAQKYVGGFKVAVGDSASVDVGESAKEQMGRVAGVVFGQDSAFGGNIVGKSAPRTDAGDNVASYRISNSWKRRGEVNSTQNCQPVFQDFTPPRDAQFGFSLKHFEISRQMRVSRMRLHCVESLSYLALHLFARLDGLLVALAQSSGDNFVGVDRSAVRNVRFSHDFHGDFFSGLGVHGQLHGALAARTEDFEVFIDLTACFSGGVNCSQFVRSRHGAGYRDGRVGNP